MKILSIGNSFSDDAQRYLREIAANDGLEIETLNLCIGGCSLKTHASHVKDGERAYLFHYNGDVDRDELISLQDGVAMRKWDVVTIQQVSTHSFVEESFYPYIHEVIAYVREQLPDAKIYIHQTWAYEHGCPRSFEVTDGKGAEFMLEGIRRAYARAKDEISAEAIIPSGELMELLYLNGASKIYRDTFHASMGLGRYVVGLLWYKLFTGRDVLNNTFSQLDEEVSKEDLAIARRCASLLDFI
jgi:hypothetical protein